MFRVMSFVPRPVASIEIGPASCNKQIRAVTDCKRYISKQIKTPESGQISQTFLKRIGSGGTHGCCSSGRRGQQVTVGPHSGSVLPSSGLILGRWPDAEGSVQGPCSGAWRRGVVTVTRRSSGEGYGGGVWRRR
uniref:Uncharacterized protein n=1 Tax=Arundo donax TaxID=35708 RepID=A0A0A9DG06_ARUDO